MDYYTLQEIAKNNLCAQCQGTFTVAWWQGRYQLRCLCGYNEEPPALERIKGYYEMLRHGELLPRMIENNIKRKMKQRREAYREGRGK